MNSTFGYVEYQKPMAFQSGDVAGSRSEVLAGLCGKAFPGSIRENDLFRKQFPSVPSLHGQSGPTESQCPESLHHVKA